MSAYQLQIFDPTPRKRGAYIVDSIGESVDELRKRAAVWRSWRIVRADKARSLEPRYNVPRSRASDYTREHVCELYCAWAKRAGLARVSVYANDGRGAYAAAGHGLAVSYVDPLEFIGPAPAGEFDDSPEATS